MYIRNKAVSKKAIDMDEKFYLKARLKFLYRKYPKKIEKNLHLEKLM